MEGLDGIKGRLVPPSPTLFAPMTIIKYTGVYRSCKSDLGVKGVH